MDKSKILKSVGVVAVVLGSAALYFSGGTETYIASIVGGVFVVIGIVLSFFKKA